MKISFFPETQNKTGDKHEVILRTLSENLFQLGFFKEEVTNQGKFLMSSKDYFE